VLSHGVEASVTELVRESNDAGYGDAWRWSATLIGGRIFERQQEAQPSAAVAAADRLPGAASVLVAEEVRWLDVGLADELSAARSRSRSVELAARELGPLVATWLDLARGGGANLWGKSRQQARPTSGGVDPGVDKAELEAAIDRMLADLGEMPGVDRPSKRALWVTALINPCNADRHSWPVLDVRSAVLTAKTPLERLSVAKTGMVDSIYKLKGGNWPMNTYYW